MGGILRAPNLTGTNVTGPNLTIEPGDGTGTTGTSGNIIFETATSNASGNTTPNTMTEAMRITPGGTLSIGTTTPATDANLTVANGHIEVQQTTAATITNGTSTIGSTGSTSASANLSDEAGTISLTTGSSTHAPSASGTLLTLNFHQAYTTAPVVVLTPTNANAAAGQYTYSIYVTSSTTGFTITDAVTLAAGTTYSWNYYVIEPK